MFQGGAKDHLPLGIANCPGQECCSFFHLILPESLSPHRTLFIPWYQNVGLERKETMVCQGMNPPSSQIASHLNKAPIKIQPRSLLIGFGIDRQHECQSFLVSVSHDLQKGDAQPICKLNIPHHFNQSSRLQIPDLPSLSHCLKMLLYQWPT